MLENCSPAKLSSTTKETIGEKKKEEKDRKEMRERKYHIFRIVSMNYIDSNLFALLPHK